MSLADKRVVVIGGSSGIGFAVARLAAEEGAEVVIASSSRDRIDRALKNLPDTVSGDRLDVTDEAAVAAFFEQVGPYDHLVYTAGDPLQIKSFGDTDLTQAQEYFKVRYWGAFTAARHGAAGIRAGGSIVLSSGSAGARPAKGWTVTASITSASEALGRALAVELGPIRVNVVRPGPTRSELWDGSIDEPEEFYTRLGDKLLVGRVGQVSEVAQTYLYLMNNGFSTGSVVTVDGGHFLT
ncbi:SDR family oxidoreductase [Actinacidiphila rubida]|uniref:NAD(P)-dependent dehydrogenase, short-chain alcohol dehydrogenase family n=1 Tax=Actinacidiphila rubida TaxID=310780 RepID=A0A1H8KBF5_9ACTN|nr:SDR family oxidoreductase [Actinacidiphila rubida]SEN90303.1 NAD(P)-dependent dehydrogenase, short-chain alcohol dehydrogenase family [Actinacidiphila rubida]